jgi:hypothetical protein
VAGFTQNLSRTEYTIDKLTKSLNYRVRYRVLNNIGWSKFSPILNVRVASQPRAPAAPQLVSATDTAITLLLSESMDNGGSHITGY